MSFSILTTQGKTLKRKKRKKRNQSQKQKQKPKARRPPPAKPAPAPKGKKASPPEEEEDEEEDEDGEDGIDLSDMTLAELKKYVKDNKLDIKVERWMSAEDLIPLIEEAMGDGDDEEGEEEEEKPLPTTGKSKAKTFPMHKGTKAPPVEEEEEEDDEEEAPRKPVAKKAGKAKAPAIDEAKEKKLLLAFCKSQDIDATAKDSYDTIKESINAYEFPREELAESEVELLTRNGLESAITED